jgi:hypothetical protein
VSVTILAVIGHQALQVVANEWADLLQYLSIHLIGSRICYLLDCSVVVKALRYCVPLIIPQKTVELIDTLLKSAKTKKN